MAEDEPLITARSASIDFPESQHDALLGQDHREPRNEEPADEPKDRKKALFAYLRTRDFWTILLLGYVE